MGSELSNPSTQRMVLASLALAVISLAAWEWGPRALGIPQFIIPPASQVWEEFLKMLTRDRLMYHTGITAMQVVVGFVLGMILGMAVGFILGMSPTAEFVLSPYILALQIAPKVAFAPLFVMWFGYTVYPKILVAVLIVFFPVMVNVLGAMHTLDRDMINLVRSFSATRLQLFWKLEFPASMPPLFSGLRIASTLSVIDMAVATQRPDRVVGVHFFNPAPMMSLVEIVRPLTASDETVAEVTAFATACGKDPVEVKDRAGFIVNALLFPYLNNAVRMLENGTANRDDIDTAMKGGCNFPMGPLALLDLVGLDTSLSILDALYEEFRDPNYAAVPALRRMVTAGQLGRKSGVGFYDYRK